MRSILTLIVAGALNGPAGAQSINVDFGREQGTPPDTYGGAGAPGFWNVIDSIGTASQRVLDLAGQPTGVTVSGYFDQVITWTIDDPGTEGDEQALLDDFLAGLGDVVVIVSFEGITPGVYDVIAYGWGPGQTQPGPIGFDGTCMAITTGQPPTNFGCTAGAWPDALQEDITHIRRRVSAVGTEIAVEWGGNSFGASGFLNGIQLIYIPACVCDFTGDQPPHVDVFDLLAFLEPWFINDTAADIDGQPGVDVMDLLFFLECWFEPACA